MSVNPPRIRSNFELFRSQFLLRFKIGVMRSCLKVLDSSLVAVFMVGKEVCVVIDWKREGGGKMRKNWTVPMETLEWMRLHFAPSGFNGRLQIGHRGRKEGVLPLFTCERSQMMDFVAHLQVSPDADYYITANMVCGVKRRLEDLFSLHNIVIDVDCHGAFSNESERETLLQDFLWRFHHDSGEEMPAPSSVVMTGRGLQFWWALNPLSVKGKWYYDQVKAFFMERIGEMLEQKEFSPLSVDGTASKNGVGYFRLPGTFNSKAKKLVTVELNEDKPVYVLQDLVAKMEEFRQEGSEVARVEKADTVTQGKAPLSALNLGKNQGDRLSQQGTSVCKNQRTWKRTEGDDRCCGRYSPEEVALMTGYHRFGFFRVKQLIQLRQLRQREKGQEERNNFNLLVYNTLLPVFGEEKSMEKLRLFNAGFQEPMSEKELEGTISTSSLGHYYKFTNETLIDFLGITEEEQVIIGLFPAEKKPFLCGGNPSKSASRRLMKEHRNQRIFSLHQEKWSNVKIAHELGISHVTVSTVLKKWKAQEQRDFLAEIHGFLAEHCSYQEIAKKLNCSVSKISRLLAKNKTEKLACSA